ncbi:MAG: chemotaxis response regulator protein-glutamate methylesterase, partial [Gammaproteobacteria bacterium]|nr:chemotaxis response regulator protein-glutamate methylesterase [Gammaproteobacteria bacterium]
MTVKVLVVDDSSFFRRQISNILNEDPQIEVIDTAEDGKDAVEKAIKLKPDVITMDVEMPNMNGIDATKQIMQKAPTRILMFSSLTMDGAKATLSALEAGAVDFLPKRFEDITQNKEDAKKVLCERVVTISRGAVARPVAARAPVAKPATVTPAPATKPASGATGAVAATRVSRSGKQYQLLAIGTSTGGPAALQEVLSGLPANFPVPILLIQHMPGTFTPAFAQRLNDICAISVKEAADGDYLKPGVAYLAPGGQQMEIKKRGSEAIIKIGAGDMHPTYKPSVDITFASVAEAYGGNVLAVVLTGMGSDGKLGAIGLKEKGATIWAQDEASCIVYGMPAAIVDAGIADKILA